MAGVLRRAASRLLVPTGRQATNRALSFAVEGQPTAASAGVFIGRACLADFDVDFASPLGVGACGTVYPGRHQSTNRDVAIKVMSPALPSGSGFSSAEVAEAIEHEERAFEQVIGRGAVHPHIVDVMGFFEGPGSEAVQQGLEAEAAAAAADEDLHYFVTERLGGETLQDRIESDEAFDEARAKESARSLSEGLAFLHEQGIVHRDVCPRNAMFTHPGAGDDEIKIIDFSHAGIRPKDAQPDAACFDKRLGTAGFLAPEILMEKGPYNSKCDVYSFGCTVHAMLANGKLPRRHPRLGIMKCLPPTVSKEATAFVDAMLAPDPNDRPSMQEVLQEPWLR